MTHDDLDVELRTAAAHHDLIAGAAVTSGPADLAELGLTGDGDVRVISQSDRQRARLGTDPVTPGRDRAFDGGLPSLDEGVVDLGDVQQLGSPRSEERRVGKECRTRWRA